MQWFATLRSVARGTGNRFAAKSQSMSTGSVCSLVVARRRSIPPDSVQEDSQKVQNRFAACDEKCYIHRHRQKTPD
jgi:hypothetical protein